MRLPIRVANAVRSRHLVLPGQRVLIALSGGPDSVALLHCLVELSRKRDLGFSLVAAHLNHGLRGTRANADENFCRKLCQRRAIPLLSAFVDTPRLGAELRRSMEESARIARHAFLAAACNRAGAHCVAVAHHADDRIETVLYRLCRGTGLAGIQGIGWSGPLRLEGEPEVGQWLEWRPTGEGERRKGQGEREQQERRWDGRPRPSSVLLTGGDARPTLKGHAQEKSVLPSLSPFAFPLSSSPLPPPSVVRPLLGCTRQEVLAYLRSKRQRYCTDETNFDVRIPRNAIRQMVLPLLEKKVHPGTRAALWRLAEEAEVHAEKRAWRREWLAGFATVSKSGLLALPAPRLGPPPEASELGDALEVLRAIWNLKDANFSSRHTQALRKLFNPSSGPKKLDLPGRLVAERRGHIVTIRRKT